MTLSFLIILASASLCLAKDPVWVNPLNPKDPQSLPTGVNKNVLVVGGGLAGLSAALELAERGYSVTIKEKYKSIGGKLFCKPVEILNQTFYIEHGFHAWFYNYYQFKDIRKRLGIDENFKSWDAVHYIFRNYKPEVIYSEGPYPLNLLGIISRSPNLKLTDAIKSVLSLPDLIFYDFDSINEKYDNLTFHEWAIQKKVVQDFYDIIMKPALSVTLNEQEIFSAAEMLSFVQIYFLTNSKADTREVTNVNYYQAILKPWTDYLLKLNVKIILDAEVLRLKIDEKGQNVYGSVDKTGDDSTVYDWVVMASEVGAVKKILANTFDYYKTSAILNPIISNCIQKHLDPMKVAPDYKVVRLWFDKKLNNSAPNILETPDFAPVNLVAQYHLLEEEFMQWSSRTGGSVMEFHCYTWSSHFSPNVSDSEVWNLISPTVELIYPEIFERNFQVLAYHVNSFQNFASFEKGLLKQRPFSNSFEMNKLNSIYLAGDWIRTDYPSALMERAVSTGREAANHILIKDNVRQVPLLVVNKKGPGLGF
ncbi:unnamed protein product [Brachionus calyciflorus]|uniref:Amine oxidase n=1 Tax=Brachionus calyciflorus TaxID=104777 RepID=A0A813PXF4_9BILA|nr:unnamed protein product [Brachionus calyciflorus]